MKMKGYVAYFVVLSVFLMQGKAFAQEQGELGKCRVGATVFRVSWSGELDEHGQLAEDKTLAITSVTGEKIPVLPRPAWYINTYVAGDSTSQTDNSCKNIVGLPVGEDRILLFLAINDPPIFPHLSLALLDANHLSVVDTKDDIGTFMFRNTNNPQDADYKPEEGIILRRVGNSEFDIRMIRESLDMCDCSDAVIEDWMRISVDEKGISTRWMRP